MLADEDQQSITEAIKARSSAFVNDHVDVWVGAEDGGVLALGADDPALLFAAAADWLGGDRETRVADVRWTGSATSPRHVLRLWLRRPALR